MPADKYLIESIVEQVLSQLSHVQKSEQVLIIGSRNEADKAALPGDGEYLTIISSDEPYDKNHIDRYLLPLLETGDMADLAMGKASSRKGKELLELLLSGKTVEVLEYEYLKYEDTAPFTLFQLYGEYAETLIGFGLCPVKSRQKNARLNHRVISEKDIEASNAKGIKRIGIAGNALVTSLAEESAKKYGIEIQRDHRGA